METAIAPARGRAEKQRRKSLTLDERRKERRASSDRRKSGPKHADIESIRQQDGTIGRRRQSDSYRRTSKSNRAATLRRERGQPRPPLAGRSGGIGRASLPGRELPPTASLLRAPALAPAPAPAAVVSKECSGDVAAMDQDNQEEEDKGGADDTSDARWTPGMVEEAAKAILGDEGHLQMRYLRWLRVVLSLSETPPAEEVIQAGLLPRLAAFIRQTDCAELRPEALCALTNIASTKCTAAVAAEPDVLPVLMSILAGPDKTLKEQSAWCLGNIAAGGVEMRDVVLSVGVLEPLLLNLSASLSPESGSTSFTRIGTWALNNLCRGTPPPPLSIVIPIVSTLQPLIESANTADAETLVDAGWTLYHITRGGSDRIDAVRSAGLLPMMPDMLLHENAKVVRPVLRAMDNLACSSGDHREALIEAGVLDPLVEILGSDSAKVRADALRVLSCIAAGSPDQVAMVASTADVVRSVMVELEEGNALCRREAAWVFLNLCECGHEAQESIIPDIVANGGISAVCQNLDRDNDAESLLVMLSLLFTILDESPSHLEEYVTLVKEADGFLKTMCLANEHDDMEIYDKAMDIIQCFGDDDEDGEYDDDVATVELDNRSSLSDTVVDDDAGHRKDRHREDDDAAAAAGVVAAGLSNATPRGRASAVAAAVAEGRLGSFGGGGDGDDDDITISNSSFQDDDDDIDDDDDDISDDSFHKEMAGLSGPITPPPWRRSSATPENSPGLSR